MTFDTERSPRPTNRQGPDWVGDVQRTAEDGRNQFDKPKLPRPLRPYQEANNPKGLTSVQPDRNK